jgi:hypothetical protein
MGIKPRLIDIGKKTTSHPQQNDRKCTVPLASAPKACKKCHHDPKKSFFSFFFRKPLIKKCRILFRPQIRRRRLKQMPLKNQSQKTMRILSIFVFMHFLWFLTFVRGTPESRHQRIRNQHKTPCPLDTHTDTFLEKSSRVTTAPPAHSKCKRKKNYTPPNTPQKTKSHPYGNISQSPSDSHRYFKKSIKLRPPNVYHYRPVSLLSSISKT